MSNIGNKEIFAKNLSSYMSKNEIDRYKLCDDLDFKYSTLSEWLSAKKYPRIDKIEKLANYFGVSKSALIEVHEHTQSNNSVAKPLATPPLTPKERRLVTAYNAHPELQPAVDKLLSIEDTGEE